MRTSFPSVLAFPPTELDNPVKGRRRSPGGAHEIARVSTRWIPGLWELPQSLKDRLGRSPGRQRALLEEGHLLLVLHALPEPGQNEREGRAFWRSPAGAWKGSTGGKNLKSLVEHIATYQAAIEALETEENEATTAEDYFSALERATPILRAARNMHKALQQARDLMPEDPDIVPLRDEAYAVERNAEFLVSDIRNAFELYVAKKTEEMSKSSQGMAVAQHRLNTLAAIFLPTATLASVMGMNLSHGMETASAPLPFLVAVVLGICLGLGVKAWLDRP